MRKLAPAGTPIKSQDITFWLKGLLMGHDYTLELARKMQEEFDTTSPHFFSTGRAAMVVLLNCLAQKTSNVKDIVLIPSYTCYSVPASIQKANLKIKICDINKNTLDYDYDKLETVDCSNVLAIVSANLYGVPNDLERLENFAKKKSIFLVDDAAQCMGARTASGRLAGTFGDAGLFSFDKGKVITSMNGGVIITRSKELSTDLFNTTKHLDSPNMMKCAAEMIKMVIYAVCLHPAVYWLPASLPFLSLGKTMYTTEYSLEKYNKSLAGIALSLYNRMNEINTIRANNGEYYRRNLPQLKHIQHFEVAPGTNPIYLRYPIRITHSGLRHDTIRMLEKNGLGATGSYPRSIADIDRVMNGMGVNGRDCKDGRIVAEQILTLPTHPHVTADDQKKIIDLIAETIS